MHHMTQQVPRRRCGWPGITAAWLFGCLAPLSNGWAQQDKQDQLPEMGTAAEATLSLEDESRLGRMVMRGLRESGAVLDDPEIGEYLQSIGGGTGLVL